ncbi:uncharacterized protein LOC111083282 [Limulus polyphemus]|uniref:Uncharacterized protein LOC111083282 n=1 Tax=Limulus polyphemus TaxID=6850 RepID=A0ABM1RVI1_LIMPO|nr:uncharacterized protein LOC111083282 [Limulus polyphemus]
MDRNIPDVRNIFYNPKKDSPPYGLQEVCEYDCSPGSRRKRRDFDGIPDEFLEEDTREVIDDEQERSGIENSNLENKKSKTKKKNKSYTDVNCTSSDYNKNSTNKNGDCGSYGTKTLTDKDIRHLERHLSMKKTIRKQISRNLAQAFVEDPNAIQSDSPSGGSASADQQSGKSTNRSFTLTRAKVTKSEQNVLDMLRETRDNPQSGHSSPSNPSPCEEQKRHSRQNGAPHMNDYTSESKENAASGDRFSFWKMFSIWGRGKR